MTRENKRIRYVSEEMSSSDEDSDYLVSSPDRRHKTRQDINQMQFQPSSTTNTGTSNHQNRPGRKPKCSSRNALMARENRLKKKMYIASLERQVGRLQADNKKLAASARDQEITIVQLRKQVKYLSSVLRNSSALGQLIGRIRGTGMSIADGKGNTSNLSRDCCIQQEKSDLSARNTHPWEEQGTVQFSTFPTPDASDFGGLDSINLNLFDDLDFYPSNIDFDTDFDSQKANLEHSYATSSISEPTGSEEGASSDEDAGICLHVSKQRLSIEFCQLCSANSINSKGLD